MIPDGSVIVFGQKVEKIEFLTGILNRKIGDAQREGTPPADISVIIRSHQDTPTGLVQELITKCQSLELANFSLRVKEKVAGQ